MAVVSVKETWKNRASNVTEQTAITIVDQTGGHREYTRSFLVRTNANTDGAKLVQNAQPFGLPALFDTYVGASGETDVYAIARKLDVKPDPSTPRLWEVDVFYSTADNPLLEPPQVEWELQQFQRPLERNTLGQSILSSAQGRPDPPLSKDDSRLVLRYTVNRLTYDPVLALLYKDAVNSDNFWGAVPNTAKLASLRGSREYRNNVLFWRTTYEIHFRPYDQTENGWNYDVLDRDYNYLTRRTAASSERKKNRACGFDARPTGDPILLNGNGSPLRPLNGAEKGAVGIFDEAPSTGGTAFRVDTEENRGVGRFPIDIDVNVGAILTDRKFFNVRFGPVGAEEIAQVTSVSEVDSNKRMATFHVTRNFGGTPVDVVANGDVIAQDAYYFTHPIYNARPFSVLGLIAP